MKALVYRGPANKAIEDRPRPEIQAPGDAIVKITKTTICGTDLHIMKGDVPTCAPGRILGHEGVGVIDSVGPGVTVSKPGDRVLISSISVWGKCEYCRRGIIAAAPPAVGLSATRSTALKRNTSHSARRYLPLSDLARRFGATHGMIMHFVESVPCRSHRTRTLPERLCEGDQTAKGKE